MLLLRDGFGYVKTSNKFSLQLCQNLHVLVEIKIQAVLCHFILS